MDCASVVSMKLLAWHPQEWPLPGRRPWSNEDWRSEVERILAARIGGSLDRVVLDRLLGRCRFAEGDLEREEACHGLAQRVRDEGGDLPNNRLFDLAVAPCQDGVVADRLAALGLTGEETGWTRMGVEKPLGFGQESAGILDERLRRCVTTGCVAGSSKLRIC